MQAIGSSRSNPTYNSWNVMTTPVLSRLNFAHLSRSTRVIRLLSLGIVLTLSALTFSEAQVSITKSSAGWKATNGNIYLELVRSSGSVQLRSLRRQGGSEW